MTELIPSHEVDLIRDQYQALGHVGVSNCYDPTLAAAAAKEIDTLTRSQYRKTDNEFLENMGDYRFMAKPKLSKVIRNVSDRSDLINGSISQQDPNFLLHIEQRPGAEGLWHTDSTAHIGPVSVVTLVGASLLRIKNDHSYTINPGDAAFMNPLLQLEHQGVNASDTEIRYGLVIGRY